MSKPYMDTCTLIVEEYCGDLTSRIFSIIAEYGGLTREQISIHAKISLQRLPTILSIMLQQRLLQYHANIYHVDTQSAYHLLRLHRIVRRVKTHYGDAAAKVISRIHLLGQASVDDLIKAYNLADTDAADDDDGAGDDGDNQQSSNGVSGVEAKGAAAKSIFKNQSELHSLLRSLLLNGYLSKTVARSYLPSVYLQDAIEELAAGDVSSKKRTRAKETSEFTVTVDRIKRKWQEEDEYDDNRDVQYTSGVKRPRLNGATGGNIRREPANVQDAKLSLDLVLRVNFAKCTRGLRDQYIKRLATRYLGKTTSTVYGALLQALENKTPTNKFLSDVGEDDAPLSSVSVHEISQLLPDSIDLTDSIEGVFSTHKSASGDGKSFKKLKVEEDFTDIGIKKEALSDSEEELDDNDSSPQSRLVLVEEHLKLLEEHPRNFCRQVGGGGRRDWLVDFSAMNNVVIENEIDTTILSRFGGKARMLVRMLRSKGKLDEKQLASYAIMRVKDVRTIMTRLQYASFVEPVEVPKDNSRSASRSIYLWNHVPERVKDMLEQHSYGSIAKMLRRYQGEKFSFRTVTEKSEMVQGRQDKLSKIDREEIVRCRVREGKLLAQVQRIDEFIAAIGKP